VTANLELDIQNKIKEIRTGKAEAPEAEVVGEDGKDRRESRNDETEN